MISDEFFNLIMILVFNYRAEYAEYHLGQLKAKIAKLRTQLLEPPKVCSSHAFIL